MSKPLKVFITYSHKNAKAKDELITHLGLLKHDGIIDIWHDNEILPGDRWRDTIFSNLADSDILLYLTSAHSLNSENCNKELARALNAEIRVIPIILEHCNWLSHQLNDFQALPDKVLPINEWAPESKGWHNVEQGIRRVVNTMQSDTCSSSGTSKVVLLPELLFQHGNALMMLGQLDMAIKAYSDTINLNQRDTRVYYNRGTAYYRKSDFDNAITDYNVVIQVNRDYTDAYYYRGTAYYRKGDFDNAIRDHTEAIKLNPELAGAYNNRGSAYAKKGELDNAIKDYNRSIRLNPKFAEAYYNRGTAYADKGEFDKIIRDHNTAIQLKPDYDKAYNNRGNAYKIKGEVGLAIEDYTKAIELNSEFPQPYYNRGVTRIRLKELEKAKSDLTTAQNMGLDISALFHNHYASVEDFEEKTGIQLPEDIAEMLTQ